MRHCQYRCRILELSQYSVRRDQMNSPCRCTAFSINELFPSKDLYMMNIWHFLLWIGRWENSKATSLPHALPSGSVGWYVSDQCTELKELGRLGRYGKDNVLYSPNPITRRNRRTLKETLDNSEIETLVHETQIDTQEKCLKGFVAGEQ